MGIQTLCGTPRIEFEVTNALAEFSSEPNWYKNIHYSEEQERGYEYVEDVFVPGKLKIRLTNGGTTELRLSTEFFYESRDLQSSALKGDPNSFRAQLENSAQSYRIQLNQKLPAIVAGYPWFEVWARDTMIAPSRSGHSEPNLGLGLRTTPFVGRSSHP